jgi:hypothetical protein
MAHLIHAATNIENSGGWVIFLLRGTDLDGLHPSFRFGPSLVETWGWYETAQAAIVENGYIF